MPEIYPAPEGFFVTNLVGDLTAIATIIPLAAVPSRISKGYLVMEPDSDTKREVIHFTTVGVSSVTAANDTTDASDATGRGCLGSIVAGAATTHDNGVTVIIAAIEQYWVRSYDAFLVGHNTDGSHKSGSVMTLPQINDTSSDHQYVFAVNELAADRTVTLPLLGANDTFVFAAFAQALTNKTIDGDSNTLTNVPAAQLKIASQAQGDILYRGASAWERLPAGTSGQFLKTLGAAANPQWATAGAVKKIWIPARNWGIQNGSPTYDTDSANSLQYWSFDAAANEGIQSDTILLPSEWGSGLTFTTRAFIAMTSATSGNVFLQMQYKDPFVDGETVAGVNAWDQQTVAVPGTAKLLKVVASAASAVAINGGDALVVRFIRLGADGSDTATGDLWFLGMEVIAS